VFCVAKFVPITKAADSESMVIIVISFPVYEYFTTQAIMHVCMRCLVRQVPTGSSAFADKSSAAASHGVSSASILRRIH